MSISIAKLIAAFVCLAALSTFGEAVRYEARPGSKVTLEGTSTIHDWTVTSAIIAGFMELESNFPLDPAQPTGDLKVTPKVDVSIPARSLKSGKSLMDDVMHDALNVKSHTNITYALKEMKPVERKAGDPLAFNTKGDLTVNGVTKELAMVVTLAPQPGNKLKASGNTQLKMTDFGIKPPAPAVGLGLIKTADEIKITFDWMTAKKAEKKTASAQ